MGARQQVVTEKIKSSNLKRGGWVGGLKAAEAHRDLFLLFAVMSKAHGWTTEENALECCRPGQSVD